MLCGVCACFVYVCICLCVSVCLCLYVCLCVSSDRPCSSYVQLVETWQEAVRGVSRCHDYCCRHHVCPPQMSGLRNVSFTRESLIRKEFWQHQGRNTIYYGCICIYGLSSHTLCPDCLRWNLSVSLVDFHLSLRFHDISFCCPATSRCETTEKMEAWQC